MAKKKQEKAGAPKGNTNAQKWTKESATALMNQALELSYDESYSFLGSIWRALYVAPSTITMIVENYDLKVILEMIKNNCAHNCFVNATHAKNQQIYLLNLKSNHGMTERVETNNTHKVQPFNIKDIISFDDDDETT